MAIESVLVVFLNACFEFADVGRDDVRYSSLANFLQALASLLHRLWKIVRVQIKALPRLLCVLSCCVHVNPHVRVLTPTYSQSLRGLCLFGRNVKHNVSHGGGVVIDVCSIGMGDITVLIALAIWHRRFEADINRCGSAVLRVAFVLSLAFSV